MKAFARLWLLNSPQLSIISHTSNALQIIFRAVLRCLRILFWWYYNLQSSQLLLLRFGFLPL
jgi:hypothetical protein